MTKTHKPLEFRDIDPLQDYYNDGRGGWYSVARLIDEAKSLEPFDLPLAGIDLDHEIWRGCNMFDMAFHVKKVMAADVSHPVILDWNGSIADGRHRIIKALIDGLATIPAVRITWKMTPCRTENEK